MIKKKQQKTYFKNKLIINYVMVKKREKKNKFPK